MCLQAQVTDLVLQRFQSAELADLPALLRFLLQHVNSQNATQVRNTISKDVGAPLSDHLLLVSLQTWGAVEECLGVHAWLQHIHTRLA